MTGEGAGVVVEEGVDAHMGQATSSVDGLGRRLTGEAEEVGHRYAGPHKERRHTDGPYTSRSNLPRRTCPCHSHRDTLDKQVVGGEGVAEGEERDNLGA